MDLSVQGVAVTHTAAAVVTGTALRAHMLTFGCTEIDANHKYRLIKAMKCCKGCSKGFPYLGTEPFHISELQPAVQYTELSPRSSHRSSS